MKYLNACLNKLFLYILTNDVHHGTSKGSIIFDMKEVKRALNMCITTLCAFRHIQFSRYKSVHCIFQVAPFLFVLNDCLIS